MTTVEKVTDLRDLDAAFTIREKVFVGEQNVPADAEYDQHDGVKLERFAVLAEFRNRGVGEALVHRVLADVRAEAPDAAQVYMHAQLRAIPLYERTGFRKVGEMFEECDIQHYQMVLG
jgi:predicted GNAT family N-acyltransferase